MTEKICRAIAVVERSRATHVVWRDWFLSVPEAERTALEKQYRYAGTLASHESFIAGYDEVLEALHELGPLPSDMLEKARREFPPITT